MTNLVIFRPRSSFSIDLERNDSGEIYRIEADPFSTLSKDLALSIGSKSPLIVADSVIPFFSRLSTWSFISDCKGDMTTVNAPVFSPAMNAGS